MGNADTHHGPERTGGQLVVDTLVGHGVDVVFGIPGIHTLALYEALIDSPIRHVTARHEQGAAFMADGYARASGRLGVAFVITGPGATNALTPVLQADSDSSPVLVIAGGMDRHLRGKRVGTLHECRDQFAVFASQLDCAARVDTVESIPEVVSDVIGRMLAGRPQPGYVEVPQDVLFETTDADMAVPEPQATHPPVPPVEALDRAAALLSDAAAPLLVVGAGAHAAHHEVRAFAERIGARVATTENGKGVLPADHELCVGVCHNGCRRFKPALSEADVVFAVGTELSLRTAGALRDSDAPLIHCNVDASVIGRHLPTAVSLLGDAQVTVTELAARVLVREPSTTDRDATVGAPAGGLDELDQILDVLRQSFPREAIFFNDMTMLCYRAVPHLPVYEPRSFFFPTGYGTLGSSMPSAVGAKIAAPERPVVALCGDGGFLFTVHELATLTQEALDVTVIVFSDSSYGAVQRTQERRYEGRTLGVALSNPDFAGLAKSFGLSARRAQSPEELRDALAELRREDGAAFVEYAFAEMPPL